MYGKLGFEAASSDIITKIGDLRADIAIYDIAGEKAKPIAIVEYKIFAERGKTQNVSNDLRKGDAVELRKHVKIYVVVLVCETTLADLDVRKSLLNKQLGHEIIFSPAEQAPGWKWCFGCWELPFEVVAVA